MHIKQVIINGFKSYKEQGPTQDFHPRLNCVVGANGSGKSIFLHAIHFVLSDFFQSLRSYEKCELLHKGTGHKVLSAFVEIVFDNSDSQIPGGKDKVRLRRTISLKKDEHFLDGKHITKTEVMNLLESAGFSRSNPYYVVQQGKIESLTTMKDFERLQLLKEIGGTQVFEERWRKSLKIMQETGSKREQISEVLKSLDERLKVLDEENEDLKKYQHLDKQRKSMEYTIYNKELQEAKQKLEEVEKKRDSVSEKSTKMYNTLLESEKKCASKDFKRLTRELQLLSTEKVLTEKCRAEAIQRTQLELDCSDLQDKVSRSSSKKVVAEQLIEQSLDNLATIKPSYASLKMQEDKLTKGILEREKKLSILYQKKGQATQFPSKAARDECLQKEIDELEHVLSINATQTERKKSEIETSLSTYLYLRRQELEAVELSGESEVLDAEIQSKEKELDEAKSLVHETTKELKRMLESIDVKTKELERNKTEKDRLQKQREEYGMQRQKEAKELEQLLSNKNMLLARQEECSKKIRELGVLSSDAFETYQGKSVQELHKMLYRCNEDLKPFSHLNNKALDQYVNFTEQREELQKRQDELNAGVQKIRELISVMDKSKDQAIEHTFKDVAGNFRRVFSELVQGGHGFLEIKKKRTSDLEDGDDDQDEDEPREADNEGRIEKYVGVAVKVSFTKHGDTQSMKQLSGGQKTVVALALIFAIQQFNPAPFYLFDEIDAALDPQYRTSFGNMVHRLADKGNTQFIATTFRPELVKVADKIYGVTHNNCVSRVDVISKVDALQFIEPDHSHSAD